MKKYTYDVFISCKSEDYKFAEEIYEFLKTNDIHTFLASKELRNLGDSEYRKAISKAMKSTYHLIVFASNANFIDSTWVYYEWDMFINAKLKGFKEGQIVTILKDVNINDINMDLWKYESFTFDNYKEKLLPYVKTPAYLEKQKRKEEEERAKQLHEEEQKKRKEAKAKLLNLAEDYHHKITNINSIDTKKIIVALRAIGIKEQICPVCNQQNDIANTYCSKCGWNFSPIDNIEGGEYLSLINEKQLETAKKIYRLSYEQLDKSLNFSKENQILKKEVYKLTAQIKQLEKQILIKNNESHKKNTPVDNPQNIHDLNNQYKDLPNNIIVEKALNKNVDACKEIARRYFYGLHGYKKNVDLANIFLKKVGLPLYENDFSIDQFQKAPLPASLKFSYKEKEFYFNISSI